MPNQTDQKSGRRSGFTLVELLVVVGILAIVGVLIIPSVRTLNEDRKIRDTARVVGAVFAAARERAGVDGVAGVEIVSIPSNPGANDGPLRYNAPNMGLILYELRGVPAYVGDAAGAEATVALVAGELHATFTGTDIITAGIQRNDFLELNNSGIRLRVLDVVEVPNVPVNDPADDYLVIANPAPNPPLPSGALSFRIHRQPVRVQSTALRLPNNLFLNMALSGHGIAPTTVANDANQLQGRQFRDFSTPLPGHPDPSGYPAAEGSTLIWFAADGSISYVTTRSYVTNPPGTPPLIYDSSFMQKPTGPVHILMCNGNSDDVDLSDLDSNAFLQDDNNMWITINHRTGSVSMGKMTQIDPSFTATNTLRTQIHGSRDLARNRRSANP